MTRTRSRRFEKKTYRCPLSGSCANTLRTIDVASVASDGYAFQVETLWRTVRAGLRVVEVPIEFVDRTVGRSKLNSSEIRKAALTLLRLRRAASRAPAIAPKPQPAEARG